MLAITTHESFGKDAADGEKPDDPEDTPAERATNGNKSEGGVGAGDEEVDRGVVKDLKEFLELVTGEAVIKSRGQIEDDHGAPEDDAGNQGP